MRELEHALQAAGGILKTARHRHLRHQIARALQRGTLTRPFPGVVIAAELAGDPSIHALAAACWQPGAVLMGQAAARLTFWPDLRIDRLELAGRPPGTIPPGVHFRRLLVPSELRIVTDQGQLTTPELTVLDLAMRDDWSCMCTALRLGVVSQESLHLAGQLLSVRRASSRLAQALVGAAGNPWSVPEYDLQELYRRHGIGGWAGNLPLRLGNQVVIPDICFTVEKVICQVDGWQHHRSREAFEADRDWHDELTAIGWQVLHFTPRQIWQRPDAVLGWTRAALRCKGRA